MSLKVLDHCLEVSIAIGGKAAPLILKYDLFDTSVTRHWLSLISADLKLGKPIWLDGIFYGSHFCTRSDLENQINLMLRDLDSIDQENRQLTLFSRHCSKSFDKRALSEIHYLKEQLTRISDIEGFTFPWPYREKLNELNFLIHRLERLLEPESDGCSIVIVPLPPSRDRLSEEELACFSTDNEFGHLYLDYATNGITVLDAFFTDSEIPFTPQADITSGAWLCFHDTRFSQHQKLENWLSTRGHQISDRKLAIGSAPLGRLRMAQKTPSDVLEELKGATRVESVNVLQGAYR